MLSVCRPAFAYSTNGDGIYPALFADEDELRALWRRPDIRRKLLKELEEKSYGVEQLAEISKLIETENSHLHDVLAYIAFDQTPVTRAERVESHREAIRRGRDYRQQEFLRFILDHYVTPGEIRAVFVEFQQRLYRG